MCLAALLFFEGDIFLWWKAEKVNFNRDPWDRAGGAETLFVYVCVCVCLPVCMCFYHQAALAHSLLKRKHYTWQTDQAFSENPSFDGNGGIIMYEINTVNWIVGNCGW